MKYHSILKNLMQMLHHYQIQVFTLTGQYLMFQTALIDVIINTQKKTINFHYRHFLVFLIFYLTSILVFKILIKRFNNFFLSFFGTLLYIFSPRIYGDSFSQQ